MIGILSTLAESSRNTLFRRSTFFTVVLIVGALTTTTFAQQHLSRRYPVRKNVRVELKNIWGTITVESWDRDEVKLSATMESPAANISPRQTADGLMVDVLADNRGRD